MENISVGVIASIAENVSIYTENLKNLASEVKSYIIQNYQNENLDEIKNLTRFTSDFYPDLFDPRAADWLFVLNTMNFALWNSKGTKQWTVNQLTGYQALCVAIKKAIIEEETPIWNPKYYTQLEQDKLENIFKSDDGETNIPLIHERLTILHQIGNILLEKYEGSFMKCIELCEHDPSKLLTRIITDFESYEDKPIYEDQKINLYTKARTLVSDIWFYFKEHEFSLNYDSSWMKSTMFVDYRVSQVLFHFKVLNYDEELLTRLERNDELEYGSKEEIEIRCCSMFSVEMLIEEMQKVCHNFIEHIQKDINYSIIIDNFLSDYRQVHDQLLMETQPLPNIKCVYY